MLLLVDIHVWDRKSLREIGSTWDNSQFEAEMSRQNDLIDLTASADCWDKHQSPNRGIPSQDQP
jgi:hypothetical protein